MSVGTLYTVNFLFCGICGTSLLWFHSYYSDQYFPVCMCCCFQFLCSKALYSAWAMILKLTNVFMFLKHLDVVGSQVSSFILLSQRSRIKLLEPPETLFTQIWCGHLKLNMSKKNQPQSHSQLFPSLLLSPLWLFFYVNHVPINLLCQLQ